jgi:ABC-2 type transport system ATP-binding protein
MSSVIVDVQHLSKRYDNVIALNDINLQLGAGIHLLRGANGSGKSTLLKVLAGVEAFDGDITISGHHLQREPQRAKAQIGWLPSDPDVYGFLRGAALLRMVAAARNVHGADHEAHIRQMLTQLGIAALIDRRFDAMSLGMQRKFMIVAALIGKPALLLLDEPANALDAEALVALNAMLIEHAHENCVLVAAHDHVFDVAATRSIALVNGQLER